MSDQPVTPDREALIVVHDMRCGVPFDLCSAHHEPEDVLFTDALDRARQQGEREGRDELMAEQRAEADEVMALVHDGTLKKATTTAIERYRQEGRDEAADMIQFRADAWRNLSDEDRYTDGAGLLTYAARLARGGPNRKDEE